MKELGIFDEMPFGQYRGVQIGTIIEDDPEYMKWAVEKAGRIALDEQAREYLKESL